MVSVRAGTILLSVLCLSACASPRKAPPEVWTGGAAAHLAQDKAACHAESAALDVNQPATYSDPRYGVTSAMAEAVARDNPLADRGAIVRQAAYDACMSDKGWTLAQ